MMRVTLRFASAVVAAVAIAASSGATHYCNGNGTLIDLGGRAYVAVDELLGHPDGHGERLYSIWVYAESNGEEGLQRGGCSGYVDCVVGGDWDVCQESSNPDAILL